MALLATVTNPSAQSPAPGGVTGAALWVKADGGLTLEGATQQVREWADQSGGTNIQTQLRAALPAHTDAITPSAAITRVASGINFNPAVDFTASSGRTLKGNANTQWDVTPVSIFAVSVAEGAPGGGFGAIFDGLASWTTDPNAAGVGLRAVSGTAYDLDGNGAATASTTSPVDRPRVVRGVYTVGTNGLGGSTWLDGVQEGTGTNSPTAATTLFEVGGRTAGATTFDPRVFNGKIAEVVVYKSVLSAADANDVESYLALKYGITLRQTPAPKNYTDSTSAIIWDATANATHNRNLAGIGRDTESGLVQRQSKSINAGEIVAIGLGEIAADNATNPNNFATDRTFLIWGRDGGDPNLTNVLTGTGLIRVQASWKVQETGEVGDVVVRVPADILPGTSPVLVQSADATFDQSDTQITLNPSAGSLETAAIDLDNGQYFTFAAIPPPAPGGVAASMALWLKANVGVTDVSGAASAWADQSGLGRNASQATAANRPAIVPVSVNFNPGLDFDGSADFMDIVGNVGFSGSNPLSFFGAGVRQGTGSFDLFLAQPGGNVGDGVFGWGPGLVVSTGSTGSGAGAGVASGTGSHAIDVPRLASVTRGNGDANAFDFYVDGGASGSSTTNLIFGADPATRIGGRVTGVDIFNGVMTEVIAYNRTLSPLELQRVHSYLAIKYGITMPQTSSLDYLGSDASVVWNASANAGYRTNIAGIGRDDKAVLNQKQSRSINTANSGDLVTIGLGSIETSNELNLNTFAADRTFLIWGDDGAGVIQNIPVPGFPGVVRVQRAWKVQETNDSGAVVVRIPASTLAGTLPVLIVSSDPTFASGSTTVPLLPSGGNLEATTTFDNATPYFTFASTPGVAPGGVTGLFTLWVKADVDVTGTTQVTNWADQTGSGHHVSQLTPAQSPSLATADPASNFNPSLTFNGTSSHLEYLGPRFVGTTAPGSVFAVAANSNVASGAWRNVTDFGVDNPHMGSFADSMRMYMNGSAPVFMAHPVPLKSNIAQVLGYHWNGGTNTGAELRKDAVSFSDPTMDFTIVGNGGTVDGMFTVGGYQAVEVWPGRISEVVVYGRNLTAAEKTRVESYLAIKWGVTLGTAAAPVSYLASDGTTAAWTGSATYQNNVAGIARDNASGLLQRQSTSVDPGDIVTMGLGTIAASNQANATPFPTDLSFLAWGRNAGELSQNVPIAVTNVTRMARSWRVQETGTVGSVLVRIPASSLTGSQPVLIRSTDATFTDADSFVALAPVGTNYEATVDFAAGEQFFTFGSVLATPGGVGGNALWLRSDLGQSCTTEACAVTQWVDQSGNAKHASASGGTLSRANAGVNFNPTLAFDANEKMTGPSLLGTATFTNGNVWIVSKKKTTPAGGSDADFYEVNGQGNGQGGLGIIQPWGNNVTYWDAGDNTDGGARRLIAPAGTIPLGVYELKTYNASTTANQTIATPANTRQAILKNGKVIVSDTTMASYPGTNNVYNVGGYATVAAQAEEIAEIIVRTGPVTAAEQQRIHSYLALKYGITLDQTAPTSYLASDGTTMWASANAPYNNNIAGIGRDDTSALLQKQSRSINTANSGDLVTIGLDPIAADNASNAGVFTVDKQFVVWGDNGLSTFLLPTVTGGPAGMKRMSRVWKVQETGTPDNVQVRIPVSALPGSGPVLIRSLDPTFATGATFESLVPNGGNYEVTTNFDNNQFFTFAALPPTAPGGVAGGLALWLRADSPGTPANGANFANGTGWLDQSGNNRHANAVTSDPQKVGGVVNFNPAVRFDGNDWMRFSTSPFVGSFTAGEVFSVVKDATPTSGNEGNPYDFGGGYNSHYTWSNQAIYNEFGTSVRLAWVPTTKAVVEAKPGVAAITGPNVNPGLFHIYATHSAPGAWGIHFDGATTATTASHTVTFGLIAGNELIGGSDGSTAAAPMPFNGDMPEIFLYNRALSATERQHVNSYLAVKYGITQLTPAAGAQDYLSSQSVVTWNGVANAAFHNDVAGIGRDDATALLQKQSASINAGNLLTIGRGVIAADNQANPTTPDADQAFFIWGHNAAATTQNVAIATTDVSRIARVWRGQETGEVGSVVVRVPATMLTGTQPALIRSADATIDAGDTFVAMARVGANYEVTFDFATGEQFFTFGSVLSRPGGVGGEALWLRADLGMNCTVDGCTVTQWDDQSGNARNAATTAGTLSRQNVGVNFNPVLAFDTAEGMRGPSLLGTATRTDGGIYIVSKKTTIAGTTDFYEYNSTAVGDGFGVFQPYVDSIVYWDAGVNDVALHRLTAPAGTIALGQFELKSYNANNTAGLIFGGTIKQSIAKNGKLVTSDGTMASYTGGNKPYQLGGITLTTTGAPATADGVEDFAEVIVYTSPITAAQHQAIESYLGIKYGITLDQTTPRNYVDSGAAPIWTAATNGVYKNGIAGIGRDDVSALAQKQSKSIHAGEFVTIGLGPLAIDNASNANAFTTDRTFLIWGHDNASSIWNPSLAVGGTSLSRMPRVWKVEETGATIGNVVVRIPTTILGGVAPTLIRSAGDATFDSTDTLVPLTLNNGFLEATIDFVDGDFFTFASQSGPVVQNYGDGYLTDGTIKGAVPGIIADTCYPTEFWEHVPIEQRGVFTGGNLGFMHAGFTGSESTLLADVNNDGKLDILAIYDGAGNSTANGTYVWLGKGDGTFETAAIRDTGGWIGGGGGGSGNESTHVGDVNGDGSVDIAFFYDGLGNAANDGTWVWLGNGDGTFQHTPIVEPAMTGGPGFAFFPAGGYTGSESTDLVDVNNDGRLDIVWVYDAGAATNQSGTRVWLGEGDGTWQTTPTTSLGLLAPGWTFSPAGGVTPNESTHLVDIDKDGAVDLVWLYDAAVGATSGVRWWKGNGNGTFQTNVHEDLGFQGGPGLAFGAQGGQTGSEMTRIVDVNRDGNLDVVWIYDAGANVAVSGTYVYLGNGNGTFNHMPVRDVGTFSNTPMLGAAYIQVGYSPNESSLMGDLNGDEVPDILWTSELGGVANSGTLVWLGKDTDKDNLADIVDTDDDNDGIPDGPDTCDAPGSIDASMQLWLKADEGLTVDGTNNAIHWKDQTLANRDANLIFGDPLKVEAGVNFNPTVAFDGGDWFRFGKSPFIAGYTAGEVFVVTKNTLAATGANGNPFDFGSGSRASHYTHSNGGGSIYDGFGTTARFAWNPTTGAVTAAKPGTTVSGPTFDTHDYHLLSTHSAAGDWGVTVDGIVRASTATNAVSFALTAVNEHIGAMASAPFVGEVAEVILYNRTLSATERSQVESYLGTKYGITIGHNYLASDDTTVYWDMTANAAYHNDVAGIGRDDDATLNQKQSGSINPGNIVSIGLATIEPTNQLNLNTFAADKTFMMWGHNNGLAGPAVLVPGSDPKLTRFGRVWKVQETQIAGLVTVRVPMLALAGTAPTLVRSTDDVFTTGDEFLPMSSNGTDYEVTIDFAHGDFFTFASFLPSPGGVAAGLGLWVKANDGPSATTDGDAVALWEDRSGKVKDLSVALPAAAVQPTFKTTSLNFNPAVSLLNVGASNQALWNQNFLGTVDGNYNIDASMFFAHTPRKTADCNGLATFTSPKDFGTVTTDHPWMAGGCVGFGNQLAAFNNFATPNLTQSGAGMTAPPNIPALHGYTWRYNVSGSFSFRQNGAVATPPAFAPSHSGRDFYLLRDNNDNANDGADETNEVVLYSRQLTGIEFQRVESYLAIKYGVTLINPTGGPQDYLSAAETIIWNGVANPTYHNAVAGIMADGASALDQRVSQSVTPGAQIAIAAGGFDFAEPIGAQSPTAILGDESSVVWGHNNGTTNINLAVTDPNALAAGIEARMARIWRDQVTGTGVPGQLSIRIPATMVESGNPTLRNPSLLISPDATFGSNTRVVPLVPVAGFYVATFPTFTAGAIPEAYFTIAGATSSVNLSKGFAPAPLAIGGTTRLTLTLTNVSPVTQSGLTFTDTLPSGLIVAPTANETTTCAPGTVTASGSTVSLAGGEVSAGQTCTVEVNVTTAAPITAPLSCPAAPLTNGSGNITGLSPNLSLASGFGACVSVVLSSDVSIVKTAPATFVAGSTVAYTLTVTNNGPSPAAAVTVTDVLPAQLTFVAAGSTPSCAAAAQTVTCNLGTLTSGQAVPITLNVQVASTLPPGTAVSNTASVTTTTPDPDSANNASTVLSPPATGDADLSIVKSTLGASVTPGNTFTYRLEITNNGPSTAANVTASDTLPAQIAFVSSSTCSAAGQNVSCGPVATLAPGASQIFEFVVRLHPAYTGDGSEPAIANIATTTSDTPDPDPADNTSAAVRPPTVNAPSADIALDKIAVEPSVAPGATFTYRLTLTNDGPSTAVDVGATDVLPVGLTFVSSPTCTAAAGTATCGPVATLDPQASTTFDIVVRLDAAFSGPSTAINNVATRTSATADPNAANDSDDADLPTVTPQADLQIVKSLTDPTGIAPGESYTYTLAVLNNGPSVAHAVTVTDVLPPYVILDPLTPLPVQCTFTPDTTPPLPPVPGGGGTVTCTSPIDPMPAGTGDTFVIPVQLHADYALSTGPQDGTDQTNSAHVGPTVTDPALQNNDSPAGAPPVGANLADVTVVKTANAPAPVAPGQAFTYTLLVSNQGPSNAATVTVTDSLPADILFEGPVPAGCFYDSVLHTIACAVTPNPLPPGASQSFVLNVRLNPAFDTSLGCAAIGNTSAASSPTTTDPIPGNNTTPSPVCPPLAGNEADVEITKSTSASPSAPVVPGTTFTYTLTVRNLGPSDAKGVVVTDVLPPFLTFVSSPSSCTAAGQTVTCPTIATLALASPTATFDILVKLDPSYVGTGADILNVATVATSSTDLNTGNNTSAASSPSVAAPSANLSMAKSIVESSVVPGGTFTYQLVATNAGPSTATNVQITDPLPPGVSFVSASAGCSQAAGIVTCVHGAPLLPTASTTTFSVQVRLDAAYGGDGSDLGNVATAASSTPDPDPTDNSNPPVFPTLVAASADVSITKTAVESTVVPGETFSYTIVVANAGPSVALNSVVTDTLPANLSFVSSSVGCTAAGQLVTCPPIASIAVSGSTAITLTVRLDPAYTGSATGLENVAHVDPETDDPQLANNDSAAAAAPTVLAASADVRIVKSVSDTLVQPGQTYTYTLTITNAGPSVARSVFATDSLPAQVTFASSPDGCVAVGQTVTCASLADLGVGATATFTFDVQLDPSYTAPGGGAGSDILNSSIVQASTADPALANNTSPAGAPPVGPGLADLAIRKDVSTAPVTPGGTFTYTITVSNQGPSTATNVVVTDVLPGTGVTTVHFVSSPDGCTAVGQTVTCGPIAAMGPGQSATLTLVVQLDPSYPPAGDGSDIPNTATIDSDTDDPTPANNTSNPATPVIGAASSDVSVTKAVVEPQALPGENFTYRITVANAGPSTALGVTVVDALPVEVEFVSSAFGCSAGGQHTVTCPPIGSLAVGATVTYEFVVTLDSAYTGDGSNVINTVTVTSATADPDTTNNTATTDIPDVGAGNTDVSLVKGVVETTLTPGALLTYRLTVSNAGPAQATSIVVSDTLPAQVAFVSSPHGCSNGGSGQVVTCTPSIATLAAGASTSLDIVVRLDPAYTGDGSNVLNTASAFPATNDPDLLNNTVSSVPLPLVGPPSTDLVIAKQAVDASVQPGGTFLYRIGVRNDGPSTATGIVVSDPLPTGLTFVSSVVSGCTVAVSTVTCSTPTLAPGATGFFEFDVRLDPAYTGDGSDLGNVATVSSATNDPDLSTNTSASAPPPAIAAATADLSITKTANEPSVTPGQTFSYDLVVSNAGPSAAVDIVVTDPLPLGLTFVSSTAGCTASGQLVTCPAIASLAPGTSTTVTLVVRLDPAYTGDGSDLANTATATSPTDPTGPTSPPAPPPTVNAPRADVRVAKSVSTAAVSPGQPFTYTMTVTNAGPSNAVNVVVTDTLPAQVAFIASMENCTAVAQSVTCPAVGSLGVGASATFTVDVLLDPSYAGTGSDILNSAIVDADTADPAMANNTSPAGAPPMGPSFADVAIRKDVSAAPVSPGDPFSYTLTVSNQGPATALNVAVSDTLPLGVAFESSPELCTNGGAGQVVTCPLVPTMLPGASMTFTLVVRLDPSYGTSGPGDGSDIANTAFVALGGPADPVPANNTSNVATPVIGTASADLSVVKTVVELTVTPGGTFTYHLVVTNHGPSTALGVEVTDTLPSQVTFVSSPSFCNATGQVLTCPPVGSLAVGATATYDIVVRLDPAYAGNGSDVLNTATVDAATPDPDPTDNVTPPVPPPTVAAASADVSITKTILEPSVVPGATFTYQLVVANAGPSTATNITIGDILPAQVTFESSVDCTAVGQFLTCPPIAAMPPGSSQTFDLVVRLDPSYVGTGLDVPNIATATAGTMIDPLPLNNVSALVTPTVVAPSADLVVAKVALEASVTPGGTFTYRIGVRNDGPSTALNVVVTDPLPGALTFVSSALNACTPGGGGVLTCGPIAALLPGDTAFFEFVVQLDPSYTGDGSDIGNVATATSATVDPNPTNNVNPPAPPPTVTAPSADVLIVKSVSSGTVPPGGQFGYRLLIHNIGPSTARNVVVTDTLPAQATFVSSPDGCTAASQSVTCPTQATLLPGVSLSFDVVVRLDPTYVGDGSNILNTGIVRADTADPAMANNSSPLGAAPVGGANADLAIVKDVSPDPVTPGTTFSYRLMVTNQGPSTATNVVVTDVLPAFVTFVSSPTGCTATPLPGPQTVTCPTIATLGPGGAVVLSLIVELDQTYAGNGSDIQNRATVDADTDDPVPANNTSNPATPIIGAANADVSLAKSVLEPNVVAGDTFTYRLVVSNAGPSTALGVTVTDPLPAAVAFVSSPQGCTASGQTVSCPPIGSLAVGDSRTFDLVVRLDPTYQGTGSDIVNVATVTSSTIDPDPTDQTTPPVPAPTVIQTGIDIAVTLASTASATVTGDVLTFTVTVTNHGPDDATGVVVSVPLPAELLLEGASGPGNYDPATGAWTIGVLAKGTSVTALLQVRALSAASLVITATTTAADQVERDPLNDAASIGLNLTGWSTFFTDLVLEGQTTPPVVAAGAVLGFELQGVNRGPTYVVDLYIEGDVPAGTTFAGVTASAGAVCTAPAPGAVGTVMCKWPGATFVDAGAKRTMTLQVRVDPSAAPGSSLIGSFFLSSLNAEYYEASNHLTLVSSVASGTMTDLALTGVMQSEGVTGTALAVPLGVGTPLRFTVRNAGPAASAGARYAIEIPPSDILGVQVLGLRVSQGPVGLTGIASAEWQVGPLAPGASATFDLTLAMRSMRATTVTMRRLASTPGDPNSANDRATLILDGSGHAEGGERYTAIGNVDGVGLGEVVTGAGRHETPQVRIYTGTGADTGLHFYAYDRNFVGGVRVATCDVDGDGTDEIVTGPGVGPGPHVRVLRLQGQVIREMVGFYAFASTFEGGVYVACADVDNDQRADVIVGQGLGGSEVRVFTVGPNLVVQKATFMAYEPGFTGGVRVAAVSTSEVGGTQYQIVTAPGPGRPLEVRAWALAGSSATLARAVPITGPEYQLGAFLDVADLNADGRLDVVLGTDAGIPALVGALTIDSGQFLGIFKPYPSSFLGGAHVTLGDIDRNGQLELLLSPGVTGRPIVDAFTIAGGATFRFRVTPIELP